jgi:hypothetical protein
MPPIGFYDRRWWLRADSKHMLVMVMVIVITTHVLGL